MTARNWELLRSFGSHVRVDDQVRVRGGRRGLVFQAWTVPAVVGRAAPPGRARGAARRRRRVTPFGERLTVWPFRHEALDADLAAVGLVREETTYAADAGRYLVTARKPAGSSAMMRAGHDRGGAP